MKYAKRAILPIFAILMFGGALALETSAQTSGNVVVKRPVVRRVIIHRSYWGYRSLRPYWGFGYDPFWSSPYQRYQEQKYYLESDLRGNQRELEKHQAKYRADGVITAKEQRELDDDIKDVRESKAKLNRFLRNN